MAIIKNIAVDQGSDTIETFMIEVLSNPTIPYDSILNPYVPLDLSNYTASLKVAADYYSPAVISLSTSSGIVLGGTTGKVSITFSAAITDAVVLTGDFCGIYQLELFDNAITRRTLQGEFILNKAL